jgi:hypothetical protein
MLGPSIVGLLKLRFDGERLPATLTKDIAWRALEGLAYLHKQWIAHGGGHQFHLALTQFHRQAQDSHIGNLMFIIPFLQTAPVAEFFRKLRSLEIGCV